MSDFKFFMLFSLIFIFIPFSISAENTDVGKDSEKATLKETNNIIFNYSKTKRTKLSESNRSTYKKALHVYVGDKTSEKELVEAGKLRCREYGLKHRQNYFVSLTGGEKKMPLMTILCSDVYGPVIRKPEQDKPEQDKPEQDKPEQDKPE